MSHCIRFYILCILRVRVYLCIFKLLGYVYIYIFSSALFALFICCWNAHGCKCSCENNFPISRLLSSLSLAVYVCVCVYTIYISFLLLVLFLFCSFFSSLDNNQILFIARNITQNNAAHHTTF